jgi:hypothetical protein
MERGLMDVGAPRNYWWQSDWPEGADQGGNTINYQFGGFPFAVRLLSIHAYSTVPNTVGTYTLALTNQGTTNSMLSGATFNMNILVANTWTTLSVTGTEADRRLALNVRATMALVSSDVGFDGSGIFFGVCFEDT